MPRAHRYRRPRRFRAPCGLLLVAAAGALVPSAVGCALEHLYAGPGDQIEAGRGDERSDARERIDGVADRPGPDVLPPDAASGGGCDTTRPWGTPVAVPPLDLAPSAAARLSGDLRTVYLHGGTPARIYSATRGAPDAAFGEPQLLATTDGQDAGAANVGVPSVTPDGLLMFFEVNVGKVQIYQALRLDRSAPFGARALVPGLQAPENTGQPYVRADGAEVYFVSRRPPAIASSTDIFRAKLTRGTISDVEHVPELAAAEDDRYPVVTADGLTVYFSSLRPVSGRISSVTYAIWTATRANPLAAFSAPTPVTSLASDANDDPTWISPDGCTMLLASTRESGAYKIFSATRLR